MRRVDPTPQRLGVTDMREPAAAIRRRIVRGVEWRIHQHMVRRVR